tara:strand:- start:799 stop:1473 length:675 start_codon:yes stop_codon:yes gene_type:complete
MDAQAFELHHAIEYMKGQPNFADVVGRSERPECFMSAGFIDGLFLTEFFGGDVDRHKEFVSHIAGKAVLDIGPCIYTPLCLWDVAANRAIIEPLYAAVSEWQTAELGKNGFANIDQAFSQGAEKLIPDLVGKIDGAILVRNCIDHSPHWAFILANISAYAAPGCQLLLWNDLMHPPAYLDGHYDITDDASSFSTLLKQLGFRIDYEFSIQNTNFLDYGCRATKL